MPTAASGTTIRRHATRLPDQRRAPTAPAEQISRADRDAHGRHVRKSVPLEAHADFEGAGNRDPLALLVGQAGSRVPELVPIRNGRMLVSPFAYFRGAALPMADDLANTPTTGLLVQACGDAHLSNFGAFASPERNLVFDVNDFDETLPAPFEWDIKRLAASLVIAGRENGFGKKACRKIALSAVGEYRTAMRGFANQTTLEVWYAYLDVASAIAGFTSQLKAKRVKATEKMVLQARTHDSMQALRKLTRVVGGRRQIISEPPMIMPIEEIFSDVKAEAIYAEIEEVLTRYRRSLQSDRRHLVEQYRLVQVARKVVGVGSVGTRAWIALMDGGDGTEPLILQAKEAQTSVLAEYCGRSKYTNQGERVVAGQYLMQAESDIFLGWTHAVGLDRVDRDFYVRQLKDWKFSAPIERMVPSGMRAYGRICGWTLARAHARSGDRIALAAYLGSSTTFDHSVADFADTYADQNDADFAAFRTAARDGVIPATAEI